VPHLDTKTPETAKDPRTLISEETFGHLVDRVMEQIPVAPFYAQRVVEQTLVFLLAASQNPGARLSPSKAVDPGWHAFLMFTREYAEFVGGLTNGGFLHHVPVVDEDITSGTALARTVDAMVTTGYRVDPELWSGWASCAEGCAFLVQFGKDAQDTRATA